MSLYPKPYLHTHWFCLSFSLTAIRPVSVCAHNSFPPIYIKLPKANILHSGLLISQSFSLFAWSLVCYRSIQLLPQPFWLHWACHISIADTSISIMASAVQFVCLSLLLFLCFYYADAECLLLPGACTSYTSLLLLLNHFADAMQIAVHSLMMKNYSRAYSMSG